MMPYFKASLLRNRLWDLNQLRTVLRFQVTEPTVVLEGHSKKVILTKFNPSANSILASASFDRTVKVWNIESQAQITDYGDFGDTIYRFDFFVTFSMLTFGFQYGMELQWIYARNNFERQGPSNV